jgi:protein phosphatase
MMDGNMVETLQTYGDASPDDTLKLVRGRSSIAPDHPWIEAHGSTDVGRVRGRNEDQFLIAELGRTIHVLQTSIERADAAVVQNRPAGLFVVADGMGGHGGGDVASTVATDAIAEYVFEMMPWMMRIETGREDDFAYELRLALQRCQARVEHVAQKKGMTAYKMGTTLTMAYVLWPGMYVVHAGDSRGYLYRKGVLRRLTRDHTLAAEIAAAQTTMPEESIEQF